MDSKLDRKELLAKLELIEVQARVTLALVQDIRRMLAVPTNPEDTVELSAGSLGQKAA